MLYVIKNSKLSLVSEKKVVERSVQNLVGENLEMLFALEKVCYEFEIEGKRIDILAFDREANAPVIIELKRENDRGLFDQGMEYFHLLSNRKNDFLVKLHQILGIDADPQKIDWSSSRVIFIGKNFTQRQQRAIDFKGIPIELYDYDWFENDYFKIQNINLEKKAQLEIQGVGGGKNIEKIQKEFKEYSIEEHFKEDWEESKVLFEKLRADILNLDSRIIEHAKRGYIGYRLPGLKWNLCYIHIYKSKLKVSLARLEKSDLKDPDDRVIAVPWKENGWGKSCDFEVKESSDIGYAMFLIRQAFDRFYK